MATAFRYETVFDASSKGAVLGAYFDDDHLATQDRVAELCDRRVVENAMTAMTACTQGWLARVRI